MSNGPGRPLTRNTPEQVAQTLGELKVFDPSQETIKANPYDPRYVPPRLADELRAHGVFPGGTRLTDESQKAIAMSTRLDPAVVFGIDRLVERRVLTIRSRQEFLRLAATNLVCELADMIQQDTLRLSIWRLNQIRRRVAEVELLSNVEEVIAATRKAARRLIEYGNRLGAIQALRDAKRFGEDLPLAGLRERVSAGLYGAQTGTERPEHWAEDEVALLWERVEDGELDKDDDEIVAAQIKLV